MKWFLLLWVLGGLFLGMAGCAKAQPPAPSQRCFYPKSTAPDGTTCYGAITSA